MPPLTEVSDAQPAASGSSAAPEISTSVSDTPHTSNPSEDPKSAHEAAPNSAPADLKSGISDKDRDRAARALQHQWRKRQRKANPSARWHEIDIQTRAQVRLDRIYSSFRGITNRTSCTQINRAGAVDAKNDPGARWRRAGFHAARLNDGDALPGNETPEGLEPVLSDLEEKGKLKTKSLETQHWLEMIDG